MEVRGSHALVTGGSRGIGKAIAEALHAAGARVSLVARSKATIEADAQRFGGTAAAVDLADAAQVEGLLDRIESEAGPVDLLVNNAGIEIDKHFADLTPDDVQAVLQTNLLTPVELCRQAVPRMLERGRGHIVNVSSMASAVAMPGISTYSISKSGLSMLTRGLNIDLKGLPVGATAVEVGTVRTDMLAALEDPDTYEPTRRAFERTFRLGLMTRLSSASVAEAVVDAVRKERRVVWLPRRAMLFPLLSEAPQRMAELLLLGVRTHDRR